MTRKDCEKFIGSMLEAIVRVYKTYNPEGEYLTLCMLERPSDENPEGKVLKLSFNNAGYDHDSKDYERPIDCRKEVLL